MYAQKVKKVTREVMTYELMCAVMSQLATHSIAHSTSKGHPNCEKGLVRCGMTK